ncbi:MAG TPA: methyltransferase domain-containing protein [Acidimicrobiia bacterium]
MATTYNPSDVAAFEHATWSRCAPGYDEGFAVLSREGVDPILDRAGVRSGSRVLDVGTGTGVAAAVAAERGAFVVGIDFSEAMITKARQLLPKLDFRVANAEALPFDDGSFDAVISNGVLHHLGQPGRALSEAHRVLDSSGSVVCSIWAEPQSLEAFGLFFAAVEEHAGGAELPHGPLFGVTDGETLTKLFVDAGFGDVAIEEIPTMWRMESIDSLLRAFGTWAQLDGFPKDVQARIEDSVRSAADRYRTKDGLVIPNPMILISASK